MTHISKGNYVTLLLEIHHIQACLSVAIYFFEGPRCFNVCSEPRYVRSEPRYVRSEPRYVCSEPRYVRSEPSFLFKKMHYAYNKRPMDSISLHYI